jgi:hypothetical protein
LRIPIKSKIFAVLGVAVLAVSAAAAPGPAPSMGVILQADNADLGGSTAVIGATIFNGDTLATENTGELRARFGPSQIYLFPNSNVSVNKTASGFSANLTGGTVLVSSGAGGTFQVLADGATVQPGSSQKTVAQISWVSSTELLLTSREGDLAVTMGDETQTVNEGASYRMMITPAAQPGSSPTPGQPVVFAGQTRFYFVAILFIAAGTTYAIIRAFESTPATN